MSLDRKPLLVEGTSRVPGSFRRLVVVGTSGSGKTTLAKDLALCLEIPHVELDALFWDPEWAPVPRELFRERVTQALSGDEWTTDGNYSVARDIVWTRADTLIWLDYSLPRVMGRLVRRTVRRIVGREELWSGNRETFSGAFLSRDSILLYAMRTYRRRQREYPEYLSRPEYEHLNVVHLRSPWAARQWLEACRTGGQPAGTFD